ncbi:MAG: amidohydrolase family protein [Thermodesulfovibrionales bacterium]|nr:amidohydrolase family protein [Thermodesulfovibrionales bacterium]
MIIDSHIHCGSRLSFNLISPLLEKAGIDGACVFAPVEDIYDRYDPFFQDTPQWIMHRKEANRYLLQLSKSQPNIFPYLFIWNDFDYEEISLGYRGVKWHRHEDEPVYNYKDKRCLEAIERITHLKIPIVFEESLENTLNFINNLAPNANIIIPHLGLLNGGYYSLEASGIWKKDNVYADTALAPLQHIKDFIKKYGTSKLFFGSDFPFGEPATELKKILILDISDKDKASIAGENILRMLKHGY